MSAPGCTFCVDAGPDFDWCRMCGRGLPEGPMPCVLPMTGVRLAVRLAKGGPLSTDGPDEREAFRLALVRKRRAAALDDHGTPVEGQRHEPEVDRG